MWPKVIAQLFELLPHVTRLVPMADRFLTSRASSDRATEAAMVAMAEGVRGDLGQVTQAHAGLYRQLQEQSALIVEVKEEARGARLGVESIEARLTALERTMSMQRLILATGLMLMAGAMILLVLIYLRLGHVG
ncbi:MAG TPA: hypothetical protein VK608_03755 [Edaphobacter sp.]|nr:hypothetical protein [Edaphobacter sp.]